MPTTIYPIAGLIETKKRFDYHFRKWLSNFCPLSPLFPLPPFCPPLSPTTPITPYNPPNSPLKQINCLRPPRRNGETTATTQNDNQMFCKGSFPLQLPISKSYTVSQQARPLPASSVRFYWLNMGIPSIWPITICDYFTWIIDFFL